MDKNAIKKYAVWARRELIERVSQRALIYGISAGGQADANAVVVNGQALTRTEQNQRRALIEQIKEKGYEQVMEEAAWTWFNRFAALRFMEVNGYLPSHIRVFTDDDGAFRPQILTEAIHLDLDGLDMEKVYALERENKKEELFKYLLIVQCNALSSILPGLFQKIEDYTELLLPDYLLREGSVIERMVTMIPEEDWTDQVQIIGWLYQYYNTEPKDQVFADLKKNIKITKEKIPAATQLFTPDWIVHYMVENSLGRLWLEGHPDSAASLLPTEGEQAAYAAGERSPGDTKWHYYLEEAPQEPEVEAQLKEIRKEYAALKPEEILCIDPCMGSGHILCVLFDVLVRIYEDYGYTAREAAVSIVQNNLWGLDIDDRAAQLAYFAVMMKARQYDRRFFSHHIQPHVYAIAESNRADKDAVKYFCNGDQKLKKAMQTIITELHDAKEYGSILTVTPQDWDALYARFDEIRDEISIYKDAALVLEPLVQTAQALGQKYHVSVTNPPYMGSSNMNPDLANYIKKQYPDTKSDISTVFMERTLHMCVDSGYTAMINIPVWMFLSSFEKMRKTIIANNTFVNMVHPGRGIFGSDFGTTTFVVGKRHIEDYQGVYCRLFEQQGEVKSIEERESVFLSGEKRFTARQDNFSKIPGSPVAYWVSEQIFNIFSGPKMMDVSETRCGMGTSNNERFLRFWFEVGEEKIGWNYTSIEETTNCLFKWYPYNKGGEYRKWYGNKQYLVNFYNNAEEIREATKNASGGRIVGSDRYFQEHVAWSDITSGEISFRLFEKGFIFDASANAAFIDEKEKITVLGYLNSKIVNGLSKIINPTIHFKSGNFLQLPFKPNSGANVDNIVKINIFLSRTDWDMFETSWDFLRHPMLTGTSALAAWEVWKSDCETRFQTLKSNEEELNRIFIDIYGLQDELTPDVADKDVTVRRFFDSKDDIPESMRGSAYALTKQDAVKSLISYAVGCMFGRYSLDEEGLAYAGGAFSEQWVVVSGQCYRRKVVEYYVSEELSRIGCLAEEYGFGDGDLPTGEKPSQRGIVCAFGSDEKSSSVNSCQYRRGTVKEIYKGIRKLSVDCTGIKGGTGDPAYDLCSPEILDAITNGDGSELVRRGWKDAERVDWQAIHCSLTTGHYPSDQDGIIPICDDEYFTDDIVGLFVKFIETVYGAETLEENLRFIADALGTKGGTSREVIRNYFLNDFYKDHLKTYQKRPIYWLFDSGKKNGFKCLIYMHRYQPDTIARIRTDYVHEQQSRYRTAIADLEQRVNNASSSERVKLNRQLQKLRGQSEELRTYEEKIHHLADQFISIDLDDGVKVNYAKFQDVLAKIK